MAHEVKDDNVSALIASVPEPMNEVCWFLIETAIAFGADPDDDAEIFSIPKRNLVALMRLQQQIGMRAQRAKDEARNKQ